MENGQAPAIHDSRVKILVVDDHPHTATTLARAIARMGAQVRVAYATSGQDALKQVATEKADILVTDMTMPEMTGLELIEKLNAEPAGRPEFSFLMTAYDTSPFSATLEALKVKKVFMKPVHPKQICQIILQAMEEMKRASAITTQQELQSNLLK